MSNDQAGCANSPGASGGKVDRDAGGLILHLAQASLHFLVWFQGSGHTSITSGLGHGGAGARGEGDLGWASPATAHHSGAAARLS